MADFLDFLDPVAREAFQRAALSRQPAYNPEGTGTGMTPEEETSWLSRRLDEGLGGISYLGKLADKTFGTRAIRGGLNMLTGAETDPTELLSFVPFSDTLGLTNEKNVVQGTQLLGNAGLITKGDDSWENQLAGFGAELALDPTTYLGIGPLTKAGQAAAKGGGKLAPKLSGRIAAGEASLLDVGLPFQKSLFGIDRTPLGTGATGEAIARNFWKPVTAPAEAAALGAEKYVGGPISALTGVNPVSKLGEFGDAVYRQGRRLFDTSAGEAATKVGQRLAEEEFLPRLKTGQQAAESGWAQGLTELDDFAKRIPVDKRYDLNAALVQNAEGYRSAAEGRLAALGFNPQEITSILATGDRVANQTRQTLGAERAVGLLSKEATDVPDWAKQANRDAQVAGLPEPFPATAFPTDYFPRTALNPEGGLGLPLPQNLSGIGQFQDARTEIFRGIPGGTLGIEDLVKNPAFSGVNRTMGPLGVQDEMLKTLTGHGMGPTPQAWQGTPWGDAAWQGAQKQAKELSEWLGRLPEKAQSEGLFNLEFMGLARARQMDSARVLASGETVMKGLSQQARPLADLQKAGIPSVPVHDALARAGLTDAPGPFQPSTASQNLAAALGVSVNDLKNMAVPDEVAKDMFRIGQMWRTPEAVQPVIEFVDRIQNLFKAGVTSPFPAFHSRNLVTGVVNMARADVLSFQAGKDMVNVLRGGQLSDATAAKLFPNLPVDEATKKFRELLIANNVAFTRSGMTGERIGGVEPLARSGLVPGELPDVGGQVRPFAGDVKQFLGGYLPEKGKLMQQANPFESLARPTGDGPRSYFTPVRQGEKLGNTAEDWIRGTHFLGAMLHDMSPAQAKLSTMKYQIDYGELTQFEKNVMRRVFPWYCVPIDHEILTREGFKFYDQLTIGDEVMGFDIQTQELKWTPLREVAEFDYDGDLMTFGCRGGTFEFTANHRWPVRVADRVVKGRKYGGDWKMVEAHELNSNHQIPLVGNFTGEDSILSPRHAAILGWILTDGYIRWIGNHCEMVVYQSSKKFLNELQTLLGSPPLLASDDRQVHKVYRLPVASEDVEAIIPYLQKKEQAPSIVGALSREAAQSMYDAMMMAEGSTTRATAQEHFAQSPKNWHVREAFQIVCILTGRTAFQSSRGCCVRKTKWIWPQHWKRESIRYKGKIWCPKTDLGTWVMRHAGAVAITGNTFTRRNLPPVLEDLVTNPGKITAVTRLVGGVRDPNQFVPSFIGEGASLPIPGAPEGQQRYISSFGLPIEDEGLKTIGSLLKGDIQRTLQQGIGMANPLVKLPFEQAFGTQLFSGRKLDELKPSATVSLGGLIPDQTARGLTELISNSPLSRAVGTVDRLLDDRKSIGATLVNIGTGVKLTDVETARQQDLAAREMVKRELTGTPGIRTREEVYAPTNLRPNLDANQRYLLELLKSTDKRVQDRIAQDKALR